MYIFKMKSTYSKIKLLPLDVLKKTGNVDHADWNYRFFLGYIARQRFRLILKLLGEGQFENLLEIGYGSGIFIPQLASFGKNIYGIDLAPAILSLIDEIESSSIQLKMREQYLDTLYALQTKDQ